jgi:hypothetical protein
MSSTSSSPRANQKKIAALFHRASKKTPVALILAGLLLMSTSAMATQFVFNYSGANISGSGELTATDLGGGSYVATSGSASVTSNGNALGSFSLLANPSAPSFNEIILGNVVFDYTDLISFPQQTSLDDYGLLFSNGSDALNIYLNDAGGGYSADLFPNSNYYARALNGDVAFTLTEKSAPVPEPGTIMLLAVGLFGLAVYGKRRSFHAAS